MKLKRILANMQEENIPEIDLKIPYDYGRELNLNLNEIKEYYPSLANYGTPLILVRYKRIYNEQILNEFTAQTIEKKITINHLKQRFNNYFNKYFTTIKGESGLWIDFKSNQYQYIKKINAFMKSFGWYPAYIVNRRTPFTNNCDKISHKDNYMRINYLEKFDSEKDMKNIEYLYHVTPDVSIDKIMDIGLTPKNKSKLSNNPERIYFLLPTSEQNIISVIQDLYDKMNSKKKQYIKSWYILRIKVKQLPSYTIFFNDPMFKPEGVSVWTFQNIPPKCIEIVKKVNLV
jgi:hypothetical protein